MSGYGTVLAVERSLRTRIPLEGLTLATIDEKLTRAAMEYGLTRERKDLGHAAQRLKSDARSNPAKRPEWADGLRQLYDSVVDEPLPDSFEDLLKKLDQAGDA